MGFYQKIGGAVNDSGEGDACAKKLRGVCLGLLDEKIQVVPDRLVVGRGMLVSLPHSLVVEHISLQINENETYMIGGNVHAHPVPDIRHHGKGLGLSAASGFIFAHLLYDAPVHQVFHTLEDSRHAEL